MTDLQELRDQLDQVNRDLAQLLAQRFDLVAEVADYKAAHDLPVADPQREAAIIDQVTQAIPRHQAEVTTVFNAIFAAARQMEANRKEVQP